jgi:hypothetical protein
MGKTMLPKDDSFDADADGAWSAEIQERIDELRNGKVKAIPWPEARQMIFDPSSALNRAIPEA